MNSIQSKVTAQGQISVPAEVRRQLGIGPGSVLVSRIDPVMKLDRAERTGAQRRFTARAGGLPDGVMVQLPGEEGIARLKWRGQYFKWSPTGYGSPRTAEEKTTVTVLTPACTVKVLGAGYVPEVHPTAE